MIRVGKYRYLVDLQEGSNLDSVSAYFIIEFEYDSKFYVGWTGSTFCKSVKKCLEHLIYYSLKGHDWPKKNNPDIVKAIEESKYITITTVEIPRDTPLLDVYLGLYDLIDKYTAYAPYGHNVINALNKAEAEKQVIHRYALRWGIPETIHRFVNNRTKTAIKSYPSRAVYQYKQISENLYKLYKKWNSVREYIDSVAPMKINPSAIYMCCNNQRRVAYGDIWRFNGDEEIIELAPDMRKVRAVDYKKLETEAENRVAKLKVKFANIQSKL